MNPTTPIPASPIGAETVGAETVGAETVGAETVGAETIDVGGVELLVGVAAILGTVPFNVAGVPAVSAPCGRTAAGLPIGLQFAGRPFDESTLLSVAYAFEQAPAGRS